MIEDDDNDGAPCEGIDLQGNTGVIKDDNVSVYENAGMMTSDIIHNGKVEVSPMEKNDEG